METIRHLRLGPQPLPLHLNAALMTWLSCATGWQAWNSGLPIWHPSLHNRVTELTGMIKKAEADHLFTAADFIAAIEVEGRRRIDGFFAGVQQYRHHPSCRDMSLPPVIWAEGSCQLFDYSDLMPDPADSSATVLLIVPSLINRAFILDLAPGRSLIRWLASQGVRCYLLDWGRPESLERGFTLTDYVAGRLERAAMMLAQHVSHPVDILGYCMGGGLVTALTVRRPDLVRRLALMATPWDFHHDNPGVARRLAASYLAMKPMVEQWHELPVDGLQILFASLDPMLVPRKFLAFSTLAPDSPAAKNFVTLEDWLNDGVPLAAAVAGECLERWYGHNDPAKGKWCIAGQAIDPGTITAPTLAFVPQNDRIVPPASARALGLAIPTATIIEPPLGHIGLVVGRHAMKMVWQPLFDFFTN